MTVTPLLAVAAGSALGGAARYLASSLLLDRSGTFPVGTLLVNVAGAFLLGFFVRGIGNEPPSALRLFLTVGFCGGFTTFSTFSLETVRLLTDGAHGRAALYVAASVGLCGIAVVIGYAAGRIIEPGG